MEEEVETVVPRPISRVYCRQSYTYYGGTPSNPSLKVQLAMSIIEEGQGSRKDRLKGYVLLSHPVMDTHYRQVILAYLTQSGIKEEDGNFLITSMSCFGYETLVLECRSGGFLTLSMDILVHVDHYQNIKRGIKIVQGSRRIIKADQYDGVWDSNSIIVDHEESWDHTVLFDVDDDNNLEYTFGDSFLQLDVPTLFFEYVIKFKPASESAFKRLKRTRIKKKSGCTICLDELVVGAKASSLPCRHRFHIGCIVEWLKTSHVCPLCRYALPAQS